MALAAAAPPACQSPVERATHTPLSGAVPAAPTRSRGASKASARTWKEALGYDIAIEAEEWRSRLLAVGQVFVMISGVVVMNDHIPLRASSFGIEDALLAGMVNIVLFSVKAAIVVVVLWPTLVCNHTDAPRRTRIASMFYQIACGGPLAGFTILWIGAKFTDTLPFVALAMMAIHGAMMLATLLLAVAVTCGPWSTDDRTWFAHMRRAQWEYTRGLVNKLLTAPEGTGDCLAGLRSPGGMLICHDGTEHPSVASLVAQCASAEGHVPHSEDRPPLEARTAPKPPSSLPEIKRMLRLGVRDDYKCAFFYPTFVLMNTCVLLLLVLLLGATMLYYGFMMQQTLGRMVQMWEEMHQVCRGDEGSLCMTTVRLPDAMNEEALAGVQFLHDFKEDLERIGDTGNLNNWSPWLDPFNHTGLDTFMRSTFDQSRSTKLRGWWPKGPLKLALSGARSFPSFVEGLPAWFFADGHLGTSRERWMQRATEASAAAASFLADVSWPMGADLRCVDAGASWGSLAMTTGSCSFQCVEWSEPGDGEMGMLGTILASLHVGYAFSCEFVRDLERSIPPAIYFAGSLVLVVGWVTVFQTHIGYKIKVLSIRSGRAEFAYNTADFPAHTSVSVTGAIISCMALGLCLLAVVAFFVLFPLAHVRLWKLLWEQRMYFVSCALPSLVFMLNPAFFRTCMDYNRGTPSSGGLFSLLNRSLTAVYIPKGVLTGLMRIVYLLGLAVLHVMRVDVTIFPSTMVTMDAAYKSFIATLMLHEPGANPVLSAFVQCLERTDGASATSRRARNRWRLALLLHKFPALRHCRCLLDRDHAAEAKESGVKALPGGVRALQLYGQGERALQAVAKARQSGVQAFRDGARASQLQLYGHGERAVQAAIRLSCGGVAAAVAGPRAASGASGPAVPGTHSL